MEEHEENEKPVAKEESTEAEVVPEPEVAETGEESTEAEVVPEPVVAETEEGSTEAEVVPEPEVAETGEGSTEAEVVPEPVVTETKEESTEPETTEEPAATETEEKTTEVQETTVSEESTETKEEAEEEDEDGEASGEDEDEYEVTRSIPTREECLALLEELEAPPELIKHSEAVAEFAMKMVEMYDLHNDRKCDSELVEAGSLLHDIGRVKTLEMTHNVEGSLILREMGFPKELCLVVERHVGAGIDVSETEKLGLPVRNFIPQKLEERMVAHADNLIEETRRIDVKTLLKRLIDKEELRFAARLIRLHNKLSKLCGVEIDEIE